MSARERLRAFILQNSYAHDMPYHLVPEGERYRDELDIPMSEYPAVVDGLLDAYRAEALREAAEKIRKAPFSEHLIPAHHKHRAARIIDPEVTK